MTERPSLADEGAIGALQGKRVDLVLGTSLGGTGRHVRAIADELRTVGATPIVHGPAPTDETFGFSASGSAFAAVDVPAVATPPAAIRVARAISQLRRQLPGAALVHAHGVRAGFVTARAVRAHRGVPLIVTWHNVPATGSLLATANGWVERRVARSSRVTLVVSADLDEHARRLGADDVRVQPVGAQPLPPPGRPAHDVRAELGATGRPLLVSIGRLHKQKGLDVLLDAAAGWQQRTTPPVLAIAGDGPERAALQERAARGNVDARWLGYVAERQVLADLLAAADVVVVPSRWEGSPLAVHEALLAGRPVVATAVGGLPGLLGPDEAALVPAGDPGALAAAVTRLLDDPAHAAAIAAAGRRAAGRWPDARSAARAVLQVYAALLVR